MCGIAGVAPFDGSEAPTTELLRAMCDTLVHRGPDDEGLDLTDGVGLGMRRLAIIDVAGGQQPIFNEDRSVRMVFNGEIYNFRDLRVDLEAKGHRFATQSDGEVLVHLWEEHGPEMLTRLNGMFAIALHDMRARRLLLARDHLGVKPLFWTRTARHLVFGSEIKALLATGLVPRELNVDAMAQFFSWEYVPAPATLLRNVQKLEPASYLDVDLSRGTTRVVRWWDALRTGHGDEANWSAAEWEEQLDQRIQQSVQRQLVSDVPLGAFLSGGVDSSLVVAGMGQGARTFSIGFNDPTYNESAWADRVARHLGLRHRVEILEPDALDLFPQLMHYMDDPIGDFSIFPTFLVSRLAREEVTVALSGDGGDELFGGYETYLAQGKARDWNRIPAPLRRGLLEPAIRALRPRPAKKGLINKARRFVEGLDHDPGLGHTRWRLFVGEGLRRELFTPDVLAGLDSPVEEHVARILADTNGRSELDRQLYVDVRSYLVDNCLVKVDRMSMACSLEVRVPLLDHQLAELAFRMPSALKINGGETKVLLKRVAARHVPRECVYRPKEGFSIPIKAWLTHELRPVVDELLDEQRLAAQGILNPAGITRLKQEHLDGRANHSHVLWAAIVFQDWLTRWGVA